MSILSEKIDVFHSDLSSMSKIVQDMLHDVVQQLNLLPGDSRHKKIASDLKQKDEIVDRLDVEIGDRCYKLLALQQPVSIDLRQLVSGIKIVGHLERVGDLSVSISKRLSSISTKGATTAPKLIQEMALTIQTMLDEVVRAYDESDVATAKAIRAEDEVIDDLHRRMIQEIISEIQSDPSQVEVLLYQSSISRKFERIADHIVHIAEEVVFLVEGRVLRHDSVVKV
ncbi:phosphate signaling complex protein PhoU [Calycomorphotria hydatis]|uniref:Phosphate-specific transport system accessory protein PhoU n=1 Tax=Calycomorphotria hydatis TaxID=2528027 RepID=A0A517TCV0_9PLAN|nr:phosphate signaling complex protein PhoU [Calycomorphotria hydatis]QDT66192.1 hypothetical protein V22_34570 [Calycomorphotria hydatis]